MVTISTGGLGSDKGFRLVDVKLIDEAVVVAGGATVYQTIYSPAIQRMSELLHLNIRTAGAVVPAAVPDLYISSTIEAVAKRGPMYAFVQGEDTQTFEFDLTTTARRMKVYYYSFGLQLIGVFLTAHAVNETTFYVDGLVADYLMPTPT